MPAWMYVAEGQSPALTRRCREVEARSPMLPAPEAWIPVDPTGAGGLALFLISGRRGEDGSVASGETRPRVSTREKWAADGSGGRNDREVEGELRGRESGGSSLPREKKRRSLPRRRAERRGRGSGRKKTGSRGLPSRPREMGL